jgi:CubicO group peptidase (beta-lactamase class C family)
MAGSAKKNDAMVKCLTDCLDRGIVAGTFPGGVVAHWHGAELAITARGRLEYPDAAVSGSGPAAVSAGTVYDLASLSKIVATLPLVLLALQSGRAELDDKAMRFLPELATGEGGSWNDAITLRRLLAHTSGLPAWRPYFVRLRGKAAYLSAIADEAPSYRPGSAVEYSDLGFMLLGFIVERIWDEALPALADRLVFRPLGMERTGYLPATLARFTGADFAPTELGNQYERGMALAYAEGRPVVGGNGSSFSLTASGVDGFSWRSGLIRGEVHDSNCHYGLGGASGHAGVFSTAPDLVRYLDFWKADGALSPALRAEAFRRQTPDGSIARGLGWILDGGLATHTGFTGTSLRYDPARGLATIALTNRVHPRVADGIGPWRLELAAALEATSAAGH